MIINFILFIIGLFLYVSFTFGAETKKEESEVTDEKKIYQNLLNTPFILLPHKQTYFLPLVYNQLPHESIYDDYKVLDQSNNGDLYKNTEAEFQFSFLFPVYRGIAKSPIDFNFAYTHHAWWQLYNSGWSRPFRETNYMPELFFRYIDPAKNMKFLGVDVLGLDFGYIHQSNGQIELLSRSWNRIFARTMIQHNEFSAIVTGWYRIPESSATDDNPDIYNYMGYGELELIQNFDKHNIRYKTPLFAKHWSTDLKYSYPWTDRLRWFISLQIGYAHSLVEYDRPTQRYGVGIAIDNILDHSER